MKIAYLYFAYKNPALIGRTISHLTCDDAAFFIHIDAKVNIEPFKYLVTNNVRFTRKRINVFWGEFSGVEATLLLVREALEASQRYDYFVLMSGSEYPLQERAYIHSFFKENQGKEFITMVKVPGLGKPLSRINTARFPSSRPILRFLSRAVAKAGFCKRDYRKHLGDLEPYSGITWWALSREACEYVLAFSERDHRLARFLENTFAPEEAYVHTILGNSPFRSRVRRGLLFEDWTGQIAHPQMIDEAHLSVFAQNACVTRDDLDGPGELLFARKFSDDNLTLLDRMDDIIRQKETKRFLGKCGVGTSP